MTPLLEVEGAEEAARPVTILCVGLCDGLIAGRRSVEDAEGHLFSPQTLHSRSPATGRSTVTTISFRNICAAIRRPPDGASLEKSHTPYQVGPSASELTRRVHRVAFHTPPWNVIGIGIPGWFHSVTIYRFLSAREAVGPDGAPVASPLGLVESVLAKATPHLNLARLRDRTQADFARGYSFYRTDAHTSVRARVGRRCDVQNQRTFGCGDYYFGIRINFWYDGCTNRFCPREP